MGRSKDTHEEKFYRDLALTLGTSGFVIAAVALPPVWGLSYVTRVLLFCFLGLGLIALGLFVDDWADLHFSSGTKPQEGRKRI